MLISSGVELWSHIISGLLIAGFAAWIVALARRERRRRRIAEAKAQSRLRLQAAAMEAAANAIFITDDRGRIEWSNSAFEALTGWSGHEAQGKGACTLLTRGAPPADAVRAMRARFAFSKPWRAEITLTRRDGGPVEVDQTVTPILGDDGRINHYVVVQEDMTEKREAEARIRFLSSYDALTALPNRELFRGRLERAVAKATRDGRHLAVMVLDLDRFAQVNDLQGREVGDKLLMAVVDRLSRFIGGELDFLARLGGDEFGLLLTGNVVTGRVAGFAQRMLAEICRPYDVDGHVINLNAAMGISMLPADGVDARVLMANADIAVRRAMRDRPNGYRFFSPEMDAELEARRRLEADLCRAVQDGGLYLHYQPIVGVQSRRIIGFEALLRWNRDGTLVLPEQFIPLAESNGMISQLGDWALAEACRQTRAWGEEGLPVVPVAVNVSAVQIQGRDLPQRIRRALRESRLPPDRLEIELTESAVVDDPDSAERLLAEIKDLGVRLAVDDFGTGYSSLARLKRFSVDKLKLDKSFVSDLAVSPADAAIARAVVALGHGLGLQVVSEGVETEDQLARLHAEGCDAVQGYLFSPPVEAAQAGQLLRLGCFA